MHHRVALGAAVLAAAAGTVAAGAQATPKYISVPLTRGADLAAYYAELSVGTPPQKERLLVDTGSPTFSFENPRNPWCSTATKPCQYYGTFNNLSSKTSKYAGPDFEDELSDFGNGDYLRDTVSIGGVSTPDLYFGYVSDYPFPDQIRNPTSTILGLALQCVNDTCIGPGPFLLPQMKNASTLERMIVSIYMGPDEINVSNAEMLLGGAYDEAKLAGPLFTVPMVDPFSQAANEGTDVLNVTAVAATVNGKHAQETYGSGAYHEGIPTILDTGNTGWGLPPAVFNVTMAAFGNYTQNYTTGAYMLDCKYRDPKNSNGNITVTFGAAGSIAVPVHALVTKFRDGTCGTYLESGFDDGPNLGDPFIRSTYAIWDAEEYKISLAQVKYTTERKIVEIPTGGFPLSIK